MTRQELRAMMEGMFISALIMLLLLVGSLALLPPTVYWGIAIFAILAGMLTLYYELKGAQEWKRARRELIYAMLLGVVLLWLFFGGATMLVFWGGIIFWAIFSVVALLLERRAKLQWQVNPTRLYCPRCGLRNEENAAACARCQLPLLPIRQSIQANTTPE